MNINDRIIYVHKYRKWSLDTIIIIIIFVIPRIYILPRIK